jgi:hypothetical protein
MVSSLIVRLSEQRRVQRQLQQAHTFLHWHQRVRMLRAHAQDHWFEWTRSVFAVCPPLLPLPLVAPTKCFALVCAPPLVVSRCLSLSLVPPIAKSTIHQGMENMVRLLHSGPFLKAKEAGRRRLLLGALRSWVLPLPSLQLAF